VPRHTQSFVFEDNGVFKLQINKLNAVALDNVCVLDPSFELTSSALDIFSLTPGFVPTPRANPIPLIRRQVADFVRKLQWRAAFDFSSDPPRFKLPSSTRWPPSQRVPPHILKLSRKILEGTKGLCSKHRGCSFPSNLSPPQRLLTESLSSGSSVITTADKGGKWTVVPLRAYLNEASRQLSNTSFYRPINFPPPAVRERLSQLLRHLHKRKFLSTRELNFFRPDETSSSTRCFKLLPKLHKEQWPNAYMPPGRPIVSDVGSITRNVGDFIDYFLQPICVMLPSYLKNTQHLIAILRSATPSPGDLLFTLDVESLYTNIPISEGISAVSSSFLRHPDSSRPDLTIISLLRVVLRSNNFSFDGQEWLQTHGVAMGKPFAGAFANIFMGSWEEKALSSFSHSPAMWVRYQDDIMGIWEHGSDLFHSFVSHLNTCHPNIRVSPTYGSSVNFLDVRLTIRDHAISYAPFFKDTDGHLILPPSSHHPPSTFTGLLYGEIYRFATHSSDRTHFHEALKIVTPVWRAQGFTRSEVRLAKARVMANTSQQLSWNTGFFPCDYPLCKCCPFASFTNVFKDLTSSLSFPILQILTCTSCNVIYVIQCSHCSKRYVGQTSQPLWKRIAQHLSNVRNPSHSSKLSFHFRNQCGLPNFSFFAIARHNNHATRLAKEAHWIATLKTCVPSGLNEVTHSEPQPTNLVLPFNALSNRLANSIRAWCRNQEIRVTYTRSSNLGEMLSHRR
jgi:hypothetical protein